VTNTWHGGRSPTNAAAVHALRRLDDIRAVRSLTMLLYDRHEGGNVWFGIEHEKRMRAVVSTIHSLTGIYPNDWRDLKDHENIESFIREVVDWQNDYAPVLEVNPR